MTSSLRHRRKEIEEQLSTELLKAEREVIQATPESRREALQRYQEALDRFSGLVVHGEPPDASGAPLQTSYTSRWVYPLLFAMQHRNTATLPRKTPRAHAPSHAVNHPGGELIEQLSRADMGKTAETVVHYPGTSNFRCTCGERLVFNSGGGRILKAVSDFRREGNSKSGRCPRCGRLHSAAIRSAGGLVQTF
jgi:hypothetical protein